MAAADTSSGSGVAPALAGASDAQRHGLEPMELTGEQLLAACETDAPETLGGAHNTDELEHPSMMGHLVRSLMPGQDLTRVTIPSWFLESRSLLEKMADTLMHPDLLIHVGQAKTPADRMVALTKWYLSGWHYKLPGVKKPYNPIIGESFAATWEHDDGSRSQYVGEQVLHRPPVTAFYFENRKNNIVCTGQVHTRSKFAAPQSAMSILEGGATLTLTDKDESYWITYPDANAHNLLMGTLRMEYGGASVIYCAKTKCKAEFTWHQKPFWGGEDNINKVTATITENGKQVAVVEGYWNDKMHITRTGGAKALFLDTKAEPILPKRVLPIHLQGPWESRRLWARTSLMLNARPTVEWGDVDKSKGLLEEDQRLLACHKKGDEFKPWEPRMFTKGSFVNPLTGDKVDNWHTFKYLNLKPYEEGEEGHNLLAESRQHSFADFRNTQPEQTAGLAGANAKVPDEFIPAASPAATPAAAEAEGAAPAEATPAAGQA